MEKKFNIVFKTLKELKLDKNILCQDFWRKIIKLQSNFNEADCWALIIENGEWLFNSGALKIELFKSWFPEALLNEHNIYTRGFHEVVNKWVIAMGNAKIHASGHSKVILFENSHCDGFDTTFVKAFGESSFSVKECIGEAFQNSRGVAGFQSKIEGWDNTIIDALDYSFVIRHDKCRGSVSKRAYSIKQ